LDVAGHVRHGNARARAHRLRRPPRLGEDDVLPRALRRDARARQQGPLAERRAPRRAAGPRDRRGPRRRKIRRRRQHQSHARRPRAARRSGASARRAHRGRLLRDRREDGDHAKPAARGERARPRRGDFHDEEEARPAGARRRLRRSAGGRVVKPEALLRKVFPPMLATLTTAPPRGENEWIYELKYDGFRAVTAISGGELAMWSRNEIDLAPRFPKVAEALLHAAEHGLEGIIAKRKTSIYEGRRSKEWLKIKTINEQELIVIGWNPSTHSSKEIGSLHLAVMGDDGELHYAGKVGTGFSYN